MASERMMRALARLESALTGLETLPRPAPPPLASPIPSPADLRLREEAKNALQLLDTVISDLKELAGSGEIGHG